MAEAGRILHHLANHAGNPKNAILFVGFQAEHTLGRRISEGRNPVKILGDETTIGRRGGQDRRLLRPRRPR